MRTTGLHRTSITLLLGLLTAASGAWAQGKTDVDDGAAVLSTESQAVLARFLPKDPKDTKKGLTPIQAAELLRLQQELAVRLGSYCNAGACIGSRGPRPPRKDTVILIRKGTQVFLKAHRM